MKKFFFTIIIPVKNAEKTIEKTIRSIIDQKISNKEIIVVDGNSTDKSQEILKKYKSKIKLIIKKDKSMYQAINRGMDLAKGKYVTYCNSDDFYLNKNFLKNLEKKIKTKNYEVIFCGGKIYDEKNKVIRKVVPKSISKKEIITLGLPSIQNGIFWKNSKLRFNLKYYVCSDYDFFCQLVFRANKFLFYKKISVGFTKRADSFGSLNHNRGIAEIKKIKNFYRKKINLNLLEYYCYLTLDRIRKYLTNL